MARIGEHAVVLGAGMSGLLAARVLREHFDRVTVVERDALPDGPEARRGVPQGRHVHGLLPRGKDLLEEFFPGLAAELLAAGAVDCDVLGEVNFQMAGRTLARVSTGYRGLQASRPQLEYHVRRRVAASPGVTIRDRCVATGVRTDADRTRVTGVELRDEHGTSALAADLVVACTGRGGVVPAWLDALGYPRPSEEGTAIDIVYRSAFVELEPGALGTDKSVTVGVRELPPRAMALFAVEGRNRHVLTLIGHAGEQPPTEASAFLDFAANIAAPALRGPLRRAELLTEISTFRYKANLRRRYERLNRFPAGLLAVGDGLCSFSPVYGQGMTVAAIQMRALQRCLAAGDRDLARRFYAAVTPEIDVAWQLTVIADSAMPHVGPHPDPLIRAAVAALDPVLAAAQRDPVVSATLYRVMGLTRRPVALMRPDIVARIAVGAARTLAEEAVVAAGHRAGGIVDRLLGAGQVTVKPPAGSV
ncbi:FAD-dependent monooxygenase [Nocardia sp. NPDC052254]|uniref:FAD-dependent monooxygenase n=1 Tax=Nocardia sp. NPDC052254 TaxID=3155681 RepID=UPI003412A01A